MPEKISVSPVTRISGLLSIDLYLDENGKVKEAKVIGEQFRGFEAMLKGRRITDAVYFTQKICGSVPWPTASLEESDSETWPAPEKPSAYTWVKAPRYHGLSLEGGPLARKIIRSVNTTPGGLAGGVMARLVARAEEAVLISKWMEDWVKQLPRDGRYIHPLSDPVNNQAVQMNDAPRGPLLHSMTTADEEIASYRVITPSAWNFSPQDETGMRGPAEESLIGAGADPANPVEPGRIIRSFDPCLSCATHFIDWEGQNKFSLNIMV